MTLKNKYELANRVLGLKHDLFIKLAAKERDEDNLKKFFGLCEETSKWKDNFLFNAYRYFSLILSIRYGEPEVDGEDYVVIGNKLLRTKGFMNKFMLDYKMYENTGVFQVSGIFYPSTYYTLGIGCTEYVNEIFIFRINNHCCMFHSGVLQQH
jgi:hypothetical protein